VCRAVRAAASHGSEEVAERAIAEEVQALVGDFEMYRAGVFTHAAARAASMLAFLFQVRGSGDEAFLHHSLDDLLNELLELLPCRFLVGIRRIAKELLQRVLRQHPPLNSASRIASWSACIVRSSSPSDGRPTGC